jgi:hypothetical protein
MFHIEIKLKADKKTKINYERTSIKVQPERKLNNVIKRILNENLRTSNDEGILNTQVKRIKCA